MRQLKIVAGCYLMLMIVACGQGKLDNINTDSEALRLANLAAEGSTNSISDGLPVVYMERSAFVSAVTDNRRLVFRFKVAPGNQLSLDGWSSINNGNDRFNTQPTIKLSAGSASGVSLQEGNYLGDLVVQPGTTRDLLNYLNSAPGNTYRYVWMVPVKTDNEVDYKFYVDNQAPENLSMQQGQLSVSAIPTNFEANPSPPRNFN